MLRTALAAALALATLSTVPADASPQRAPAVITRQVTYDGRTVTVRLTPVSVRGPGFEVLVQQADGSFVAAAVPAEERTYVGGVDGVPGAVSSGILRGNGTFDGQIVFDRGATWRFLDGNVYETRGLTPPDTYHWPSAAEAARNVTVSPGQAGDTTYRWDIGFDLANNWYTAAPISSSTTAAVEAVELMTVSLLDVYVPDTMLRPAIGRVVIRAAAGQDPYAGGGATLSNLGTEWNANQADADVDDVALLHGVGGGGVAYVSTAGTDSGLSVNGGTGLQRSILRHELGHTWGPDDNHTNGPEGATIMSGNAYERFDGTELSSIFRYRDSRQKASAPFAPLGRFTTPLPPYAALDLVDRLTGGVVHSYRPLANDHDANGGRLKLVAAAAISHLGGKVTRAGDVLTYHPPAVVVQMVDWVTYVVRDASGKQATGVSLFRLDPKSSVGPVSSWPRVALVPRVRYEVVNTQSGWLAGAPRRFKKPGPLVQRARGADKTRFTVQPRGTAYRLRNVGGRGCLAVAGKGVVLDKCRTGRGQLFRVVAHPKLGDVIISVRTGRCLTPVRGSMTSGARLTLARCTAAHSRSWRFDAPQVSSWPRASVDTTPHGLRQVLSGLPLGVPGATTGISPLLLRTAGGNATSFVFTAHGDGTYEIRNVQSDKCVDLYGSSSDLGAEVATWSCSGTDNQRWQVLRNPAGALAIRSLSSGYCLTTAGGLGVAGTSTVQVECGFDRAQRWKLS